jgi:hypothetical protein
MNLNAAKKLLSNPNFTNWFGNSKVIDDTGAPLQVYHGTNNTFDSFNKKEIGKNFGKAVGYKRGFFFSDDPNVANVMNFDVDQLSPQTIPAYLSLKKPLQINIKNGQRIKGHWSTFDEPDNYYDNMADDINRMARQGRHDGIIIKNTDTNKSMYVAFEPTQIKSPFNRGTFDPKDPNILKGAAAAIGAASALAGNNAYASQWKNFKSDEEGLQDSYNPLDMAIAAATGGATLTLKAAAAALDPIIDTVSRQIFGE